jgi:hypothetical membrane protein
MIRRTAAARALTIALLAAPVIVLIAEAITASAWTNPRYDYIYNFVSDLGVPGPPQHAFGQDINSPLAIVMNCAWILYGSIAIAAAAVLLRFSAGLRPILLGALALTFGAGISLVGLFHGSQESVNNGLITYHIIGADATIVGGNLLSILAGSFGPRAGMPRRLAAATIALGITGLIGFATFMIDVSSGIQADVGLFERLAIYPIAATHLAMATALLVTWPRKTTATVATATLAGSNQRS